MNLLDDWGIDLRKPGGSSSFFPLRQIVSAVLKDEQAGKLLREMLFSQSAIRELTSEELAAYKIDDTANWIGMAAVSSLTEDSGL